MGSSLTQGYNYVRLGSDVLSAPGTTLDVSYIPTGYRFLICFLSLESANDIVLLSMKFNGSADTYRVQILYSDGAAISASAEQHAYAQIAGSVIDANRASSFTITINQDNVSLARKGFHFEGGSSYATLTGSGYWNSSAEINQVTITSTQDMIAGSKLFVYGVM
jgi:hypothetical protein